MPNRRPQLSLIAPAASPQEAAAVVAALERFMRDTAAPPAQSAPAPDPWRVAAILEGVSGGVAADGEPHPWITG